MNLTDTEFESIVSMMSKLLVMYQSRGVHNSLVVPARLPEFGVQRVLAPDYISEVVVKKQCSFGQIYPPPGIVGRLLAWLTEEIIDYEHCWQRGAFFSYTHLGRWHKVFVYQSDFEELHDDDTRCTFAGLTLGVQAELPLARAVLADLETSLEAMVNDSAHGFSGLSPLMYFGDPQEIRSTMLEDLRDFMDNIGAKLIEVAEKLDETAHQLWKQDLLVASREQSGYPRLVIIRPEAEPGRDDSHERIHHSGWDRWQKAWKTFSLCDIGMHRNFCLLFLCEHDLAEVPCGPHGRGFPVAQLKDWVQSCVPLIQVTHDTVEAY